ncbi:Stk1 family PASTA domain-containing Ser/Thr kinase [Cohnella sp. REN36]|uniref:Stk1 family PASTA domain-containing Ser/Thr kinase n=1 Tax=Cohnella sp. REN36 TaxID=2887347 RepID=UPI001D13B365|nr:Stk1 family PASTA domain-containing Ser/Thr kinase [Cohnella sp. REN36]MCC3373008.1 Stk1 family PASTA domain-containing Ser/Thr kinase [Cohnella sp. REN36]
MIGHLLSGRYEIMNRVGGGGMALVYKARDILLNRFVAVKVLRQQFVHDDEFVRRFRREAQAAASLSHPNIVSIYDVGQEDDTHYIIMEYVDGANLNEIIRDRAPLQAAEAVRIASQICDALDHAHHSQIIHRDIKPHNILIGKNGRVKVTDFGIARAVTASTITQTGSVVGSVHYFSPEHAKGVATGEKSDIYSLGIVLYQMLTGRLPFLGESPISVALKHLQEPFEEPRLVNPHIPQSVENIILRAMRKNPQERYRSAQEMLADLETCLQPQRLNEPRAQFGEDADEGEQTRVIPAIRPNMGTSAGDTIIKKGSESERRDEPEPERRRRRWVMPTVFGLLAALLIGILLWAVFYLKGQLSPSDVQVPTVVGDTLEDARTKLEGVGLKVADPVLKEASSEVEENHVIRQSKQDMAVKEGSSVTLTVSTGPELPTMEALKGKMYNDAVDILKGLGLTTDVVKNEVFDESDPGTVLDQKPAAGETFDPAKDTVTLTVSKGLESFPMPNLISMTLAEVKAELAKYNLKLPDRNIFQEPSYTTKGKVFKQFPAEQNETVQAGTEVQIWISSGFPADAKQKSVPVTVSPVEGKSSTIKIVVTDALGDSHVVWGPKKISATTTIPVKVVLSPGQQGLIMVFRDDQYFDSIPVPYEDAPVIVDPPSSPDPTTTDDPNAGTDNGTNQDGGQ